MKAFIRGVLRLTARYAMIAAVSLPAASIYSYMVAFGNPPSRWTIFALVVPTLIISEWLWRRTDR